MALNVNGYTNRFQVFADFAQKNVEAGNKKAIANAARMETPVGKKAFVVVASETDKVGGVFTRSMEEMSANNATRAIFLKEVVKIFGGSDKVPPNVRDALNLIDYGHGQPLTARRILAVKTAIDEFRAAQGAGEKAPAQAGREVMKAATASKTMAAKKTKAADPDMKSLKISSAKAKAMVAASCTLLGVDLDEETANEAARLLKSYGNKLPAKVARVLSNFIVNTAVQEGLDEDAVRNLAGDMKGWKVFDFGDPRLAAMGKKFVQRQNDYIKQKIADPTSFSKKYPDIFTQVYTDGNRGVWNINGETLELGSDPDKIVEKVSSALKTSNARKAVSSLLHQGSLADIESIFSRSGAFVGYDDDGLPKEDLLYKLSGGDMFIHRDSARDGHTILSDANVSYGLDVSEDGKTATVTVSIDKHISSYSSSSPDFRIGKATITQKTTIDLTKDMPEVVGVAFSQTFTPDEINRTGAAK